MSKISATCFRRPSEKLVIHAWRESLGRDFFPATVSFYKGNLCR